MPCGLSAHALDREPLLADPHNLGSELAAYQLEPRGISVGVRTGGQPRVAALQPQRAISSSTSASGRQLARSQVVAQIPIEAIVVERAAEVEQHRSVRPAHPRGRRLRNALR